MTIAQYIYDTHQTDITYACKRAHTRCTHHLKANPPRIEWRFGDGSGIYTYKSGFYEVAPDIRVVISDDED